MKNRRRIVCLLLALAFFKEDHAQAGQQYIDSVKAHIRQIDSLISELSVDTAAGIIISSAHLSKLPNGISCESAELFKNGKTGTVYRLSYAGSCDSIFRLQDYYFNNNKIVFVRTVTTLDNKDVSDQYYFNDEIVNAAKGELYIKDGYEILKKIGN